MIYIIAIILILVGIFVYDYAHKQKFCRQYYIVVYTVFVLIAGLRYKLGGDTIGYIQMWNTLPTITDLLNYGFFVWPEHYQPLWYLINALCKLVSDDFTFFQIIHAVIINSVFGWFIWKYSKIPFFTTLLYAVFFFFIYNTEILRASLAVCMFLLGYPALENKKWFKYGFYCILAIGFHIEALFILLFPMLQLLKKANWKWSILLTGISLVFVYTDILLHIVYKLFLNEHVFNKIINYSVLSNSVGKLNIVGISFWVISSIVIPSFLLYATNQKTNLLRTILFVYMFIRILYIRYFILVERLLDFVYPLFIVLLSNVSCDIFKRTNFYSLSRYVLICVYFVIGYFHGYGFYSKKNEYGDALYRRYFPYTSVIYSDRYAIAERELMMYNYTL